MGDVAPKCGWPSSKSGIFRTKARMRPTITAALSFLYERLLRVAFGTATLRRPFTVTRTLTTEVKVV